MKKGSPYGIHRVIEPKGILPQPAIRLNNNMNELFNNEILCDVITLNIDSASFAQIKKEAGNDIEKIKQIMLSIVERYGKHKNPVTGSGGMFVGRVNKIGDTLHDKITLNVGDKIASLVSLSLTPLKINKIKNINITSDQVDIDGQAILFESSIWTKLPDDINEKLALAILDVAGAPAQTEKLIKPGDSVLIIGGAGKSGLLCAYTARKSLGSNGSIIGVTRSEAGIDLMKRSGFYDKTIQISAKDAIGLLKKIENITNNRLCDLVINCVNITDCEMGSIITCRDNGIVYFFSMATSFTKAALGAEGIGKDVTMIIGNGYTKGHAEMALNILRDSEFIKKTYEERYC